MEISPQLLLTEQLNQFIRALKSGYQTPLPELIPDAYRSFEIEHETKEIIKNERSLLVENV